MFTGAVFCDECCTPLNPNDDEIYTETGGALCEEHRQERQPQHKPDQLVVKFWLNAELIDPEAQGDEGFYPFEFAMPVELGVKTLPLSAHDLLIFMGSRVFDRPGELLDDCRKAAEEVNQHAQFLMRGGSTARSRGGASGEGSGGETK